MPPWLFVCPASRGLGLAVARRLFRTTDLPLVATARRNLDDTRQQILEGGGKNVDESRLTVLEVDVTEESTIEAAAVHCKSAFPPSSSHLHLGFFLPGILHPEKSPSQIDAEKALSTFRINTLGPLLLMKHFSSFLPKKSAKVSVNTISSAKVSSATAHSSSDDPDDVANSEGMEHPFPPAHHATLATLSARVGSITDNKSIGGWYSYRASKAGVNQLVRTLDNHLRRSSGENAIAIALHPGTVKTGLSREFWGNVEEGKLFSPEFSAERLCGVVAGIGVEAGRGKCWDWKGTEVPP